MQGIASINGAYVSDEVSATNDTANASFTGTTDTAVMRMNTSGAATGAMQVATTAASGTVITLNSAGLYMFSISMFYLGAVSVAAGISYGASNAAPITADPLVGVANVIWAVDLVGIAASSNPISHSVPVRVVQAEIAAGTSTLRIHATNSAGAAPVGIVAVGVQYRLEKIADLSV